MDGFKLTILIGILVNVINVIVVNGRPATNLGGCESTYCAGLRDICKNGGRCVEDPKNRCMGKCQCSRMYSGPYCEVKKSSLPVTLAPERLKKPRTYGNIMSFFKSLSQKKPTKNTGVKAKLNNSKKIKGGKKIYGKNLKELTTKAMVSSNGEDKTTVTSTTKIPIVIKKSESDSLSPKSETIDDKVDTNKTEISDQPNKEDANLKDKAKNKSVSSTEDDDETVQFVKPNQTDVESNRKDKFSVKNDRGIHDRHFDLTIGRTGAGASEMTTSTPEITVTGDFISPDLELTLESFRDLLQADSLFSSGFGLPDIPSDTNQTNNGEVNSNVQEDAQPFGNMSDVLSQRTSIMSSLHENTPDRAFSGLSPAIDVSGANKMFNSNSQGGSLTETFRLSPLETLFSNIINGSITSKPLRANEQTVHPTLERNSSKSQGQIPEGSFRNQTNDANSKINNTKRNPHVFAPDINTKGTQSNKNKILTNKSFGKDNHLSLKKHLSGETVRGDITSGQSKQDKTNMTSALHLNTNSTANPEDSNTQTLTSAYEETVKQQTSKLSSKLNQMSKTVNSSTTNKNTTSHDHLTDLKPTINGKLNPSFQKNDTSVQPSNSASKSTDSSSSTNNTVMSEQIDVNLHKSSNSSKLLPKSNANSISVSTNTDYSPTSVSKPTIKQADNVTANATTAGNGGTNDQNGSGTRFISKTNSRINNNTTNDFSGTTANKGNNIKGVGDRINNKGSAINNESIHKNVTNKSYLNDSNVIDERINNNKSKNNNHSDKKENQNNNNSKSTKNKSNGSAINKGTESPNSNGIAGSDHKGSKIKKNNGRNSSKSNGTENRNNKGNDITRKKVNDVSVNKSSDTSNIRNIEIINNKGSHSTDNKDSNSFNNKGSGISNSKGRESSIESGNESTETKNKEKKSGVKNPSTNEATLKAPKDKIIKDQQKSSFEKSNTREHELTSVESTVDKEVQHMDNVFDLSGIKTPDISGLHVSGSKTDGHISQANYDVKTLSQNTNKKGSENEFFNIDPKISDAVPGSLSIISSPNLKSSEVKFSALRAVSRELATKLGDNAIENKEIEKSLLNNDKKDLMHVKKSSASEKDGVVVANAEFQPNDIDKKVKLSEETTNVNEDKVVIQNDSKNGHQTEIFKSEKTQADLEQQNAEKTTVELKHSGENVTSVDSASIQKDETMDSNSIKSTTFGEKNEMNSLLTNVETASNQISNDKPKNDQAISKLLKNDETISSLRTTTNIRNENSLGMTTVSELNTVLGPTKDSITLDKASSDMKVSKISKESGLVTSIVSSKKISSKAGLESSTLSPIVIPSKTKDTESVKVKITKSPEKMENGELSENTKQAVNFDLTLTGNSSLKESHQNTSKTNWDQSENRNFTLESVVSSPALTSMEPTSQRERPILPVENLTSSNEPLKGNTTTVSDNLVSSSVHETTTSPLIVISTKTQGNKVKKHNSNSQQQPKS